MIHVEDYINEKHKEYLKKVSKHAIEIKFDEIFKDPSLKDLNIFILKPKQAYYNNTFMYTPYIDYFIEYYDDDNELLLSYLKLKFMIDRSGNKKYSKELFLDDLYTYLLSDSMVKKIKNMVKDNYNISLSPTNKYKYEAIEFNDKHGQILLEIGMSIKIFVPIVTHYIHVTGNKNKTDQFLAYAFKDILKYFEGENNMYNKIYEFIISKINRSKNSDKTHWNNVEIFGLDIPTETEKVLMRLLVDIFYKYAFKGNIVAMNATSIKRNIYWSLVGNYEFNVKPMSEVQDEDGLSDFDKVEMNMSKFDESYIIMGNLNIKQVIKVLKKKYDVTFDDDEIQYYLDNLKVDKLQRDMMFDLFGKYFGNIRDEYSITRKQYAKLVIIMKKRLEMHGYVIMQHIISGILQTNPHVKRMPKKLMLKIVNSDRFLELKEKYKSTFDIISTDNALFNNINTLISSNVLLIDYQASENTYKRIDISGNTDLIIDEYLRLIIEMI